MVSGNYFSMLGVKPALGRVFNSQEDDQVYGGHPSVVLGYDYWVRRFTRDPVGGRQEDPRQQLPDDHRRRVGRRLRRHRSDALAADSRAHPDEGGDGAGVGMGPHGRPAHAVGAGVRAAQARTDRRIGGGAAAGTLPADPRARDDAAGRQGLVGLLARTVHEGSGSRSRRRRSATRRSATTSRRRSSC